MGRLYAYLVDAGYDAAYLDTCTPLGLNLLVESTNALREKQGWKAIN